MFSCTYVTWGCLEHVMFDRWVPFTHGSPSKGNVGCKAMLEIELKWRADQTKNVRYTRMQFQIVFKNHLH